LRAAPSVWPTLAGAAGLFVYAAHEDLVWPQIIGCVLVGLVVTSFAAVAKPVRFDVDVGAPTRARVGEPFETSVRIANQGGGARCGVVVRHRWRRRQGGRSLVPEMVAFVDVVPRGGERRLRSTRTPVARGVASAADIEVEIAGPFGLFSRISSGVSSNRLVVLPASASPLEMTTGPDRHVGAAAGLTPDADVRGVRDWRSGDQISQVHWRSVVRTGRMTVVERDTRSAGSLVVVVVAPPRRGRPVRDAAFEAAISTAAATAVAAHRRGVQTCFVARAEGAGFRHPADESALLESFARVEVALVPDDALIEHALSHAAWGGAIVLVAARTTPPQWRATLRAGADAVGALVIDAAGTS